MTDRIKPLVQQIQKILIEERYPITSGGVIGNKTYEAMVHYQTKMREKAEPPSVTNKPAPTGKKLTAEEQISRIEYPWIIKARSDIGIKEGPGAANNKVVLKYYTEAGVPQLHDEVAWCAAFVGAMLKRSGLKGSGSLMAKSYLKWGKTLPAPAPGCVCVLHRGAPSNPSGHVGFLLSWSETTVTLLGGNQDNEVNITKFARSRVVDGKGFRWPTAKEGWNG